MPSQQILQEKISEVEEITTLLKDHKVIGIASLQKVRAPQLQNFKRNLADKVYMKVIKNTLMKRAIQKSEENQELQELQKYLTGSNIYLFTNINPFKLTLLLERNKVRITAKSGDIAAFDVTIPAGNTGQPPGPIISRLNAVGLPTRIESGSVWVNRDTLVANKGDVISEELAAVLSKLRMKTVEAGLTIRAAYDHGLILTEEELQIDLDQTRQNIADSHSEALALSFSIAFPTTENMEPLVQLAYQEAYSLAVNAAIPTRDTIVDLIQKSEAEALCLNRKISG